MAKKRRNKQQQLTIFDLIDWYCPEYVEWKAGSTDQVGMYLKITALLDGRFIWQTTDTRDRWPDGRSCFHRFGHVPAVTIEPLATFEEALASARKELETRSFVRWLG